MREFGSTLELSDRGGRLKHRLAGRPVHGGDPIQLCFSGGWVTGRYEWSGQAHEPAYFHYSLELIAEGQVEPGIIVIPEGAILRWP